MAYDSNNRSERLLQGRRFTTDELTLTQEAFTDVFDLGAGEIYTDDGLIPTGSTQLPYSGSSQDGGIVSGSVVNPSIETDVAVLKYWYRHKLRPAKNGNREVYYFTESEPSSLTDTVGNDGLIESDQLTNFISSKYIIATDSPNTTEGLQPGYKIQVFKSTAASAGSISEAASSPSEFVFDYKTGILTWVDGNIPTSNQYVYMTVYQYVGRTLRSQIDDGSIGGGGSTDISALNTFTGSIQAEVDSLTAATSSYLTSVPSGTISGSQQITDFGFISSSSDVDFNSITNVPSGLVSGSAQIVAGLPAGVVSGSAQTLAHLVGQDVTVQTLIAETYIVSSSVSHITQSFSSGSTIFGDDITDTHQITGSLLLSGSFSFYEIDGGNF